MSTDRTTIRRRDKRIWYVVMGLFVAVFLFTFLTQKYKGSDGVKAASLAEFDPGYIISDYQMGNYNSMSEAEIQAFLTAKNSCGNINHSYYQQLTANNPGVIWHFDDGHFICLSEERFGDGEAIGSGETAAHIIWQAAQDYEINPQVLIVLLQKETSLITDPIPNNYDYRKATGYGCPDTAACSSEYYGFKNQVRNAAALFSTVLNGGWTNYPLGKNYIQYNPNASCGGSVVNIRSLATSALYRYTPYQPNEGAIAAGYGTAYCGAYGNRNFYLYFEDWFGGITTDGYESMESPRYMTNKESGELKYYTVKRYTSRGLCLSGSANDDVCTLYSELENTEWDWRGMEIPRYLTSDSQTKKINLSGEKANIDLAGKTIYYDRKTVLPNGEQCLLPEDDMKYVGWCAVFDTLIEADLEEQAMQIPRLMRVMKDTYFIDPVTKDKLAYINKNSEYDFSYKIDLPDVGLCLVAVGKSGCILDSTLRETWNKMEFEREMVVNNNVYKVDVNSGERDTSILMNRGMVRKFVSKIYYKEEWCLRTEYDDGLGFNKCVFSSQLGEMWNKLNKKEEKTIKANTRKIDAVSLDGGLTMLNEEKRMFIAKYFVASKMQWCYKTEYDDALSTNYCFLENDLR